MFVLSRRDCMLGVDSLKIPSLSSSFLKRYPIMVLFCLSLSL